jgi:hypothetical protein
MINAGTPCPVDGKIGKEALAIWNKYEFERPDFETYVKRIKKREKIDAKLEKEQIILPKKKPVNWINPK